MLDDTRFIERLAFFNGQRLFAEDLQGIEEFNREMRWLHNSSLHQPGIGNGFVVTGHKGDREVTISPGYALDDQGREIVLNQSMTEPVPPVASDSGKTVIYDLVVSYPDDNDLPETETRESVCAGKGACTDRGAVRREEAPVFCWVRLVRNQLGEPDAKDAKLGADITYHRRIRLARAEILNCQLDKDISIAERGIARTSCRPYLACGKLKPSVWEPFKIHREGTALDIEAGVSAVVDTSSASFVTTPCYTAHIEGSRVVEAKDTEGSQTLLAPVYVDIRETKPESFKLVAFNLALGGGSTGPAFAPEQMADWTIVWMGVEG